jgi:hypothetical protein
MLGISLYEAATAMSPERYCDTLVNASVIGIINRSCRISELVTSKVSNFPHA